MNATYPTLCLIAVLALPAPAFSQQICTGFGPQTPRDISDGAGLNPQTFPEAPPVTDMNLCDIHTHTNAEHKGPGFSIFAGTGDKGGYQCNETTDLTEAELRDPSNGKGGFGGVSPGDSLEVHWVYTTCQVDPGPTLGSCFSDSCTNPTLRVEAQVFLVVNDDTAPDFAAFSYDGNIVNGRHQAKTLPSGTGDPVMFRGSTTGAGYSQSVCSPFQATWGVRPECSKLSFSSLNAWAEKRNVFDEVSSQAGRKLVTAPELLAPID